MLWPVDEVRPGGAPAWTVGAPCRYNPELWFSDRDDDIAAAKAICTAVCPLERRIACMDYAFDNGIEYGVFGGVSREERIEKQCHECGETKPLTGYGRNKRYMDGHRNVCRPCAAPIKQPTISQELLREHARARIEAGRQRQKAACAERIKQYAQLSGEVGQKEAMRILGISRGTAWRYDKQLREEAA
jgi:WhiB family redox-sensing transcriptional regulator